MDRTVYRPQGAGRRQRGMTIPMLALSIFAIMAVAALAIDVGVLYTARTSAQHAADAAALAGAWTFMDPVATQPGAAQQAAIATAGQYNVMGHAVTLTASGSCPATAGTVCVDTANHRVTASVALTGTNAISTYFAQVAGGSFAKVAVQTMATAEAATTATGSNCVKPIFIPNTIMSTKSPACACGDTTKCAAPGVPAATPEVIYNPANTYSAWFTANKAALMGSLIGTGIRPTNPGSALLPSQFYSLQLGAPGASVYRCNLGQCLNQCGYSAVQCGSSFPVETGNMNGPTNQGVNDLITSFNTTDADIWYPQNPTANGFAYEIGGDPSNLQYSSKQVALAPVWNDCTNLGGQDLSSGYHGQQVQVIGFATIFIQGMGSGSVQARLVNTSLCSAGGGGGTGPLGVPIRLVQNP